MSIYPPVKDTAMVGAYPGLVKSGGGYVWDEVLEYRVWCHPQDDAGSVDDMDDYYYAFDTYEEALECSQTETGAEQPIALILQEEYIAEPNEGQYIHVKESRLTEWPVIFLKRPRRTANTIPDFLSPEAPENRLDILRGLV